MDMELYTGWRFEVDTDPHIAKEREANAADATGLAEFAFRAGEFDIAAMDPRKWCRQERQSRNDCAGHSNSATGEAAFVVATGRVIQFSPHFSYIVAQDFDGIRTDSGSTIAGGLKQGRDVGYCPLDICPYPRVYDRRITQAMRDAAAQYKIGAYSVIRTYEDVMAWFLSGQGGINWGTLHGFRGSGQLLETWSSGPAHATALLGPSVRKDSRGEHYVWLWNSGYPVPGWYEISPTAIRGALNNRFTVAIGMTKLATPAPQPIGFNVLGV